MAHKVLFDGNDSGLIRVVGVGDYMPLKAHQAAVTECELKSKQLLDAMDERDALAAYANRLSTFIKLSAEKWAGVAEVEPTFWNLLRVANELPQQNQSSGKTTINKQIIKDLALAAGFKLKPQPDGAEDLNPYVYEFAKMLGAHVALSGYADIVKAECLRLQAGDVVAISLKAEFFEHTEFHEFYKKGLTSLMPAGVHCVIMAEGCTLSELPDDELALAGLQRVGASSAMDALAEEVQALKDWRQLALQFDGHRMQAMSMLKMVATGNFDMEEVRQFIAAAPVSGDKHLAEIRAQAVIDAVVSHEVKYGNSQFGRHLREYADSIRRGEVK